jgi:amino-acid N-acetyltransferase
MKTEKRTWTMRNAQEADLGGVCELLKRCDLPADDVNDALLPGLVVAENGDTLIGAAGVEVHGRHALLRSVAVAPEMRGSGLGAGLVRDRIAWTQSRGIGSIYLLTTTAETYFTQHGFVTAARESAPPEIQASREFSDLCPSTAVLMHFTGANTAR